MSPTMLRRATPLLHLSSTSAIIHPPFLIPDALDLSTSFPVFDVQLQLFFSCRPTMRLINTATLKLEGPFMGTSPPYAILSHTWGDEELSLQQFTTSEPQAQSKGLQKIQSASAQAVKDGHQYLWVDTVCIDKTSSAELSEAINSMYNWYSKAEACYVYLEDFDQDLAKCRWFSRGWTLQELLAPWATNMTFFDGNWRSIGTKMTLLTQISEATLIDPSCLQRTRTVWTFSVADRMSWASRRKTTRPEDIAYCLLGLFRVNMPLLYGEGAQRAFLRLQHEILQGTSDETILAWAVPAEMMLFWGALALSPEWFEPGTSYRPTRLLGDKSWISITKQGIAFRAKLWGHVRTGGLILLKCQQADSLDTVAFHILPLRIGTNQYIRTAPELHIIPAGTLYLFSKDVTITLRTDIFDIADFVHENPVNYMAIVRQPGDESGYLPPERPRTWFQNQNAIVFSPIGVKDMRGDIVSFRPVEPSMSSFIVAFYRLTKSQVKKQTFSQNRSFLVSGYDIVGVYNNPSERQDIHSNLHSLCDAIEDHLRSDKLPPESTKLVLATRSERDGLDVWTLAGGEHVHVQLSNCGDPRLGYMAFAFIFAGTCWKTHIKAQIKAMKDSWAKSPDATPAISKEEDTETSESAGEYKEETSESEKASESEEEEEEEEREETAA